MEFRRERSSISRNNHPFDIRKSNTYGSFELFKINNLKPKPFLNPILKIAIIHIFVFIIKFPWHKRFKYKVRRIYPDQENDYPNLSFP